MENIAEIQNKIAQYLVDRVFEPWEEVVLNCELSETENASNFMVFYITLDLEDRRKVPIADCELDFHDLCVDLNNAYLEKTGNRWGSFDLRIDSSGKYRFEFSYEKPKRINGIRDEESWDRFENYIDSA